METMVAEKPVVNFGPFSLHREERVLLRDGQPLELPPTSLEILQALVDAPGEVFGRQALISHLSSATGDTDVHRHVIRLNAALASQAGHYIAQLPGRGYLFVGSVRTPEAAAGAPLRRLGIKDVVGRDRTVAELAQWLRAQRQVTVVGPGGMGKTTVALALADALSAEMPDGVHFVDLVAIAKPGLVSTTVATALGIELRGNDMLDPMPRLRRWLEGRRVMLVLDNCEHLIDEAARLVEGLLACREVRILATSREPLRSRGENVHHLAALSCPPAHARLDASRAMTYSAVELFVRRATAAPGAFVLQNEHVADVGEICRGLDGMPMAIELAAPHVAEMGVAGLRERLSERLSALQIPVPHDSHARHQTLQATIDWSHARLGAAERSVLRRLALFRGAFPIDSALRLGMVGGLERSDALQALIGLVSKSLVSVEMVRGHVQYRLLETTRGYALAKLNEAGEFAEASDAHAEDCCLRLQEAESQWQDTPAPDWVGHHRALVDDVRAALDWSTAPGRDLLAAVRLVLTAMPLFGRLTLLLEFVPRMRDLIERVRTDRPDRPELEFRLTTALGDLVLFTEGQVQSIATYGRAYELSLSMEDPMDRTAGLAVMWVHGHFLGDYQTMYVAADRLIQQMRVAPDPPMELFSRRAMAYALHYRGDQAGAIHYTRSALATPGGGNWPGFYLFPTQIHRDVAMRFVLARALWISGQPDQARAMAAEAVDCSLRDSPASLCVAIAIGACPVALWSGDDTQAQALVDRMRDHASRHAVQFGTAWAAIFQSAIDRRRTRLPIPDAARASLKAVEKDMLTTLQVGPVDADTLARAENAQAGWCAPEVLRVQGLALQHAGASPDDHFERSLTLSQFQGANSWALRTAISQVECARGERRKKMVGGLETIYRRFTEGFETADLRAARELLESPAP